MALPFQIIEPIGKGSQGSVFRGYHFDMQRVIAIKKVNHAHIARKEIGILEYVNRRCPYTVEYMGYHMDTEQNYWIMMQHEDGVNGKHIHELMKSGCYMDEEKVLAIVYRLACALQFMHHHDIIYGDVKLENFLYRPPHKVTLIDYGCARKGPTLHHRIGTPYYFSPEKINGTSSYPADVWALGVMAYMLMCGVHPFHVQKKYSDMTAFYDHLMSTPLQFEHPRWSMISTDTKALLEGMLQKSANTRMTIDEVLLHATMKNLYPLEYRDVQSQTIAQ